MIAGFGLIAYKVLEEKFQRKITQVGVKSIMDRDEIYQIDRQDSERNEEVDRYTPANVK
jgi:predicted RNA-binding protein with PUA domain